MTDDERIRYIAHLMIQRPRNEPLLRPEDHTVIVGLVHAGLLTKSAGHRLRTAAAMSGKTTADVWLEQVL